EKFLILATDKVTSSDEEVVEEVRESKKKRRKLQSSKITFKRSKHDHASSKSPVQTSETTTKEVYKIPDDSEDSRQHNNPQQETSFASTNSRKGAGYQESQ
ncbi:19980_t:CDS:2, partial [Gigaspora margarita]